jgi:membrane fusion protein (multidrug efflux system)
MTKRIYIYLGLACIILAKPFSFAHAETASSEDSIPMTLPAIYQLADEKSRVIRISEQSLRAAQEGVRQAKSDLARAEQQQKATGSSISTTKSSMTVTEASIEEAKVNMENLAREDKRYEALLRENAVTRQQYDQIHTSYLSAKARYAQVKQTRAMQSNVVEEQGYHLSASEAALQQAQAAVELAELNLSYCYIIATRSGMVGSRDINLGQLVNPGQTLVSIVDENEIWVEANYRETQLPNIHEGAEVEIRVDAVPGRTFKGRVERLSDATGSAFSLVPIDNATGNFVKVEQRLTIRISLAENAPEDLQLLKAGYSVETEIKY